MDGDSALPPKKRSRFFSNGKSRIESFLRGRKDDRSEQRSPDTHPTQREDSSSPPDVGTRYVSAARTVKFVPVEQGRGFDSREHASGFVPLASSTDPSRTTRDSIAAVYTHNSPYHLQQGQESHGTVGVAQRSQQFGAQVDWNTIPPSDPRLFNAFANVPGSSNDARQQYSEGLSCQTTSSSEFVESLSNPFTRTTDSVGVPTLVTAQRQSAQSDLSIHAYPTQFVAQGNESSRHVPVAQRALTTITSKSLQHKLLSQHAAVAVHNRPPSNTMLGPEPTLLGQLPDGLRVDLDRDDTGALLPIRLNRPDTQMFSRTLPVRCFSRVAPTTPANFYTSPKRIEHAIAVSTMSLKRKRTHSTSPPAAHIYVHTGDPDFNIFANGFLLYPELCFALAAQLPLRDLVGLYSISKDFHTIIDTRFTTTCLAVALQRAPQSAQTYKFRSYAQYCRYDPAARIPHPDPAKAATQTPRKVPSFQWVAFVMHREKVVHEMATIFAERGCPLPARCSLALKRMWVLMDIPDNARRIATIHNHRLFTDLDLYFLMCFFIKLDMVANDPVGSEKRDGLRKLLLSQRGGLDIILKVLKREMWKKKSDYLIAWVKNTMNIENFTEAQLNEMGVSDVLGVSRDQVGRGKFEYWGLKGIIDERTGQRRSYLLRPDQLVMREAIRRGIRFNRHFMRCVLYGYVRSDTLESYAPRKYGRRETERLSEDYNINEQVGSFRALAIEDGGDSLLDLGNTSRGSSYTICKEAVSKQERAMRDGHDRFLTTLVAISERERMGGP